MWWVGRGVVGGEGFGGWGRGVVGGVGGEGCGSGEGMVGGEGVVGGEGLGEGYRTYIMYMHSIATQVVSTPLVALVT